MPSSESAAWAPTWRAASRILVTPSPPSTTFTPPAAAELAKEIGAKHAAKLADVTAAADVIFTVVTDDAAQLGVFAESGDSLLTGAKGKIFVNCATITPKTHVEVEAPRQEGRRRLARGLHGLVHSPGAQRHALSHVRRRQGKFDKIKPILEKLSTALRYIGPTGQAAQVKALVNMVMNINTAGLAEGLGLGAALGLDLNMLREVFLQTGANSQVLKTDGEDMQNRDHSCFFSGAHAAKDSGIAAQLGKDVGLNLPLADATKAQFDKMVKLGLGGLDKSGVAELTFKGRHG